MSATTTPPVALTIAGSDSGGGAGIQADLKTFAALGVHGTTAVTALTAQNTVGVRGAHVAPVEFVEAQIEAVLDDFDVKAVKCGMLATREIIEAVAAKAAEADLPNLVVDPVIVAGSGDRLLDPGAEDAYRDKLFPHASVVTPNVHEAQMLLGRTLDDIDDIEHACRELADWGPQAVVVTGGDLEGTDVIDVAFFDGRAIELRSSRVDTPNNHGTGCTFASAVAARLAHGVDIPTALRLANKYVHGALRGSVGWHLGAGHGPIDHFGWGRNDG